MNSSAKLTVSEVLDMADAKGLQRPVWTWRKLQVYNGFSHEERVRGWQATKLAIEMGLLPPADSFSCQRCGAVPPVRLYYHSEDYLLLPQCVLCRACHLKIHRARSV